MLVVLSVVSFAECREFPKDCRIGKLTLSYVATIKPNELSPPYIVTKSGRVWAPEFTEDDSAVLLWDGKNIYVIPVPIVGTANHVIRCTNGCGSATICAFDKQSVFACESRHTIVEHCVSEGTKRTIGVHDALSITVADRKKRTLLVTGYNSLAIIDMKGNQLRHWSTKSDLQVVCSAISGKSAASSVFATLGGSEVVWLHGNDVNKYRLNPWSSSVSFKPHSTIVVYGDTSMNDQPFSDQVHTIKGFDLKSNDHLYDLPIGKWPARSISHHHSSGLMVVNPLLGEFLVIKPA